MARKREVFPPTQERRYLLLGLGIGTILGILLGVGFVGATNDGSWLIFTLTFGWSLGLGIALALNPATRRPDRTNRES